MDEPIWMWVAFNAAVLLLLALDLGIFNRHEHKISSKEALGWSLFWIVLSLLFNGYVYLWLGHQKGIDFLTAYLLEKSLSVDNLFVFVLTFTYFAVPDSLQHRVLFWGVIGALVMRGILITVGSVLLLTFHWLLYGFGAFLIFTGGKLLFTDAEKEEEDLSKNIGVRLAKRFLPVTDKYEGSKFFTKQNGKRAATPLFLVLVVIEITDLVFATDSIPAVLAVTKDSFIVYTSNVCAILGLRALYFLLADVVDKFKYLQTGLGIILSFIGVKMVIEPFYKIESAVSLSVVVSVLVIAGVASVWSNRSKAVKNDR